MNRFFLEKNTNSYSTDYYSQSWFSQYVAHGDFGVELFFVISGFILGLPFAKAHLIGGRKVDVKGFFLKRLTRLEPPYILVMVALFFANVFLVNNLSFTEGVKSLFSSIFYIHNFVYGRETYPLINAVAWSLEIEVQFYLLSPILGLVFKVPKRLGRWSILIVSAIITVFASNFLTLPFISLLDFWGFFAVGFLLVDLYIAPPKLTIQPSWFLSLLTLLLLFSVFTVRNHTMSSMEYALATLCQLVMIFVLYYNILFVGSLSFLRNKWVTNIGGMCYSIYLLHGVCFSIVGGVLIKNKLTEIRSLDYLFYSILMIASMLIICGLFFLLIERPCMNKHWHKDLFKKIKSRSFLMSSIKS